MKTTSVRARALCHALQDRGLKTTLCALLAGAAMCGLAAPAAAQTARQHRALDSNGVDLTHGDFVMAFVEGSIGSGDSELALVRTRIGSGIGSWHVSSGGHQWDGLFLTRTVGTSGTVISVNKDDRYELFNSLGTLPTGSSLTAEGAEHHYRTSDGTLIVFGDPTGSSGSASTHCNGSPGQGNCSQLPLSIESPDGKSVSIAWKIWRSCSDEIIDENNPQPDCSYWARIESVSNSFGYRIAFNYATDGDSSLNGVPPPNTWQRRTRSDLYNDAVSATAPQASLFYSYSSPSADSVEVTDMGGRTWRFASDGFRITAIRRPGVQTDMTTVSYGGPGNSVSSVTSEGVTTSYARSVSGGIATMTVTNALNQATTIVSDLNIGRPTSVTDPLNRTTSYQYDSGRLQRVTRPEGDYVHYTYDSRGNLLETRLRDKAGNPANDIVASASYDSSCSNPVTCNQPNSVTDARQNTTDYKYDPNHGGIRRATLPAPTPNAVRPQTRYSYTFANGEYRLTGTSQCQTLAGETDGSPAACANGADEVRTAITYDSNGNVLQVSKGNGNNTLTAVTNMTYDALGNLRTVDGPLPTADDKVHLHYVEGRRLLATVSPDPDGPTQPLLPRAVRNVFDPATGLPVRTEQGNVADAANPDWATFVAAQAVETQYDDRARPKAHKLVSGGTIHALTQMSYDPLGRIDCVAQRMNEQIFATIATAACELGARKVVGEDHGPDRIARTFYDEAGRVSQVWTALGVDGVQAAEATFGYRPNGQVEFAVDARGSRTQYVYDSHDRLERIIYPSASVPAGYNDSTPVSALATAGAVNPGDDELYAYDPAGNVTAFTNRADETIGFGYDALGRLISKNLPGAEPDASYGYDLLGRMLPATQNGMTIGLTWDALGRQRTQTIPIASIANPVFTSDYDLAGRRTRLTWPIDASGPTAYYVDYDYLVTGETEKVREKGATSGAGVLTTFGYDQLGRRASIARGNGATTGYQYDPVSRLKRIEHGFAGTTHDVRLDFAYNPASQIVSTTRSNPSDPAAADPYAWTGHGNGTTSSSADGRNRLSSHGGATPTYDARGNITFDGTFNYTYSSENLLTSGANSGPLYYDPLMRFYQSGPSYYIHDGVTGQFIGDYYNGNTVGRYVPGPDTDEALTLIDKFGNRTWFHSDERGSVIASSGGAGANNRVVLFDEYGKRGSGGSWRFGFTGQLHLINDIYDYKNRNYNARLGRFLQADPIGYAGGMNLYAYVGNDPVNFVDPLGLCGSSASTHDGYYRGKTVVCPGSGSGSGNEGGLGVGIGAPHRFQLAALAEEGGEGGPPAQRSDPNYCQIGNYIMSTADKAGDVSLHLTGAGLVIAGAGAVTGNPLAVAGGATLAQIGNIVGIGSGALQTVGGLAQGWGGGGYKNAEAGLANIASGAVISRALRASIPRGWHVN